jgi:hypothetical protein
MSNLRDASPVTSDGSLRASFSSCGPVPHGVAFLLRVLFPLATLACATFGNGRRQGYGNAFLKFSSRNSKLPTRSIGIVLLWIAPRCGLPAVVKKPAQIPRIGANWQQTSSAHRCPRYPVSVYLNWSEPSRCYSSCYLWSKKSHTSRVQPEACRP